MVMDFLFPPDTKTKGEITIYVVKYMFKINGILLKRIVVGSVLLHKKINVWGILMKVNLKL